MRAHLCEYVHMISDQVPTAALRRDLAEILVKVHQGDHVHVTHYGRPAAVLVPPEWYEKALSAMFDAEVNSQEEE